MASYCRRKSISRELLLEGVEALLAARGHAAAGWPRLDSRDQTRRFPHHGRLQLLTHKDADFSNWFPQIVATLMALPVRSCFIDGEAVVCDENGLAVFDQIRGYE